MMTELERRRWIKAIWPFVMDQKSPQDEWQFFDRWHCCLFRDDVRGDSPYCQYS